MGGTINSSTMPWSGALLKGGIAPSQHVWRTNHLLPKFTAIISETVNIEQGVFSLYLEVGTKAGSFNLTLKVDLVRRGANLLRRMSKNTSLSVS